MEEPEILRALQGIFRGVFMDGDIVLDPAMNSNDIVGWDSFKQVEIIMAIEEEYGIRTRPKDLDALQNVGDLVRLVQRKLNE